MGQNTKERPIIFSSEMVNAILEGRKTMTRRIMKGSTEHRGKYNPAYMEVWKNHDGWKNICPYGKIGDRLWIRETIFMSRKLSRITLEITDVRVERLQDITEEDAEADGITPNEGSERSLYKYRHRFQYLWDKINAGRGSWASNPFVWVVSFKVVT